ncbi:XRE family transcriptional regulator [Bacillus pseudomycoides]|uniref:helix-turn-helix domain-containing protein n=1 Tax=Bacillus pseudomycoides TaxID=64104 RepID=UPI00030DE63C|nr:helix-turn-helix transcriptional regulator [Bacillus pseudomycoides]MDR4190073.1 helix-turn-helix transcriptional regulator [Bacillus pseudomycoides]MED0855456.1 helix-turn-helix transcriptional regulator [Bacillus pseudomycoides]PEP40446.1 XRE family transcriptional regulator [Bacillus pseudomycoides]PEP43152.1 XRE family transcriptional regulator [Bacillus pseudomycoides]PFX48687.1 XRE family transcriptional regulator [Bacillus pseudomycoides]
MLTERLKEARKMRKLTQQGLADKVNATKGTISNYENGHSTPSNEMLKDLANILGVTTDYLLGRDDELGPSNQLPELTKKDTRDIARDLEKTLEDLENSEDALMFDGEPIDEHTREMIRISLENSMRMAKELAKQKFTPNKYKKD